MTNLLALTLWSGGQTQLSTKPRFARDVKVSMAQPTQPVSSRHITGYGG